MKKLLPLLLIFLLLVSCGTPLETAKYDEDTILGDGAKRLTVTVTDPDKTVVFTILTNAETVGDALMEHNLIAGDNAQYGLYIKMVNGVRADFDSDGAYWGFYDKDGGYMMSGVDSTEFNDGDAYELKYTEG